MGEQTLYAEVSRGLWRAALYYRRLPPAGRRLGSRSPTNKELALRFAENAGVAAALARSAGLHS